MKKTKHFLISLGELEKEHVFENRMKTMFYDAISPTALKNKIL